MQGTSIGKGFQGGIKRYNFARGPMTHGSKSHRQIGAPSAPFVHAPAHSASRYRNSVSGAAADSLTHRLPPLLLRFHWVEHHSGSRVPAQAHAGANGERDRDRQEARGAGACRYLFVLQSFATTVTRRVSSA